MIRNSSVRIRFWLAICGVLLYVLLPGPERSPFSGTPLASKAWLVFFAIILVGLFSALYHPRKLVRWRWLVLLSIFVAAKLVLAPYLIHFGWRGFYETALEWRATETRLRPTSFLTDGRIRPYRIDPVLAFDGASFALDFLNEVPVRRDPEVIRRDVDLPLRVTWEGWIAAGPTQERVTISCLGRVRVSAGVHILLDGKCAPGDVFQLPANERLTIIYEKPAGLEPLFIVEGITGTVTPRSFATADVILARRVAIAITILGFLSLVVLAAAFFEAYAPLSLLIDEVLLARMKSAAFLIVALMVAAAVRHTIPMRHSTVLLSAFDDPLVYESQARMIMQNGLLMVDSAGHGDAFYFYPFYSYALAGAHLLFGEDYATIVLFDELCIAASILLCWALLRRYVRETAGVIMLLLVAYFESTMMNRYASEPFSDNLFIPFVLAVIVAASAALERRHRTLFFLAGSLTALAAATRPSFLLFFPFFGLWLLADARSGNLSRRMSNAVVFGAGFLVAIAPFTLRNWIVTKRFILLVNGSVNFPLYITPPGEPTLNLLKNGRLPTPIESLSLCARYIASHPFLTTWTMTRKLGFTLGLPRLGPDGQSPPLFFVVISLAFAFLLWAKLIPRDLKAVILVFLLSHLAAIMSAVPWTYGYKTILPFHLVMLICIAFAIPVSRTRAVAPKRRQAVGEALTTADIATILVTEETSIADVRRVISEMNAGFVLISLNGVPPQKDIQKLLAYAGEFDIVDGVAQYETEGIPSPLYGRWLTWAVAKYVGGLYGQLHWKDTAGALRLMRRDVAEIIAAQCEAGGWRVGVEMTAAILDGGYTVVQIPVMDRRSTADSPRRALSKEIGRRLRVAAYATSCYVHRDRRGNPSGQPRAVNSPAVLLP